MEKLYFVLKRKQTNWFAWLFTPTFEIISVHRTKKDARMSGKWYHKISEHTRTNWHRWSKEYGSTV